MRAVGDMSLSDARVLSGLSRLCLTHQGTRLTKMSG